MSLNLTRLARLLRATRLALCFAVLAGSVVTPSALLAQGKAFKLGDLVDPFTPPKLEDLEKTAKWKDMPVLDGMALRRDREQKTKPMVSVKEALALKNDSGVDNNAKILSSLGRLPGDDKEADFNATMNRIVYGDVNSTNPVLASSIVEADILGLIGFGLFSFDEKLKPFASKDSVVSWQASEDGMYDKVVMRKDLTWSDGKPITAHDIKFSFLAIMTEAVPVTAQRSGTDKLKWVEAYDDQTVVFFHKEPTSVNIWNVNYSILPKHVYEKTLPVDPTLKSSKEHLRLEEAPVTGGSYVIKERVRDSHIVLERRESSYMHEGKQVRDKPYFKTMRFRIRPNQSVALQSVLAGDADDMQLTPEQWTSQTKGNDFNNVATKVVGEEWTEFHFCWNTKKPFFTDKRVRKAMSYAYDHQEMLKVLRYNLDRACVGTFHPSSPWCPPKPPKPYVQDFDKAEQLLDEAGWKDSDGDGVRDKMIDGKKVKFDFTIITVNKDDRIKICNLLADNLSQIGVRCTVRPQDFPTVIQSLVKRDYEAAFGGWGTGTDPYTTENIFKTGEERNYAEYSNAEVDKLFEQGLKEFDFEKRRKIYQRIHEILWEDQPYTWLFYQNGYFAFSKRLRGYEFSPRGPFHFSPGISAIWTPVDQ
jgi:peptide/nickel transport system substrate-binding protein